MNLSNVQVFVGFVKVGEINIMEEEGIVRTVKDKLKVTISNGRLL